MFSADPQPPVVRSVSLGFFLDPFKDELLYSVLARHRKIAGDRATHGLIEDAFGIPNRRRVNTLLPARLQALVDRIPNAPSGLLGELIERHTAYPYLSRFLIPPAAAELYEHLANGQAHALRGLAGTLRRSRADDRHCLAFCPECVEADIADIGIAGWRRTQQIPGVFVCPWHGSVLRETEVEVGSTAELVCCPSDPNQGQPLENPLSARDAMEMAKHTAWLLEKSGPPLSMDRLYGEILRRFSELGMPEPGRADAHRVQDALEQRFGTAALNAICGGQGAPARSQPWFKLLTRKRSRLCLQPAECLLLLIFLEMNPVGAIGAECGA